MANKEKCSSCDRVITIIASDKEFLELGIALAGFLCGNGAKTKCTLCQKTEEDALYRATVECQGN